MQTLQNLTERCQWHHKRQCFHRTDFKLKNTLAYEKRAYMGSFKIRGTKISLKCPFRSLYTLTIRRLSATVDAHQKILLRGDDVKCWKNNLKIYWNHLCAYFKMYSFHHLVLKTKTFYIQFLIALCKSILFSRFPEQIMNFCVEYLQCTYENVHKVVKRPYLPRLLLKYTSIWVYAQTTVSCTLNSLQTWSRGLNEMKMKVYTWE